MNNYKKVLLVLMSSLVFSGCSEPSSGTNFENEVPDEISLTDENVIGHLLPFKTCSIRRLQQDDFYKLAIEVKAKGGTSDDWIATAVKIAKYLGNLGLATDFEVTVSRNDLGNLEPETVNGFRWLAKAEYAKDINNSWLASIGQDTQWFVRYATDDSVASIADIELSNEYYRLTDEDLENEVEVNNILQEKYQLDDDWKLPLANMNDSITEAEKYIGNSNEKSKYLDNLVKLISSTDSDITNMDCSISMER